LKYSSNDELPSGIIELKNSKCDAGLRSVILKVEILIMY